MGKNFFNCITCLVFSAKVGLLRERCSDEGHRRGGTLVLCISAGVYKCIGEGPREGPPIRELGRMSFWAMYGALVSKIKDGLFVVSVFLPGRGDCSLFLVPGFLSSLETSKLA